MAAAMNILGLAWLAWSSLGHTESGYATVFACDGDPLAGGPTRALGRHVRPDDHGYAHRTLPDWTPAIIVHGWSWSIAPKIDSGPYGAMVGDQWVIKRRHSEPGRWRGIVDVTPPVARDLGATWHESQCRWRERITLITIKPEIYDGIQTLVRAALSATADH